MLLELVEPAAPFGRLHLVHRDNVTAFCQSRVPALERPDNVERLHLPSAHGYKFSQDWQALNNLRWLQKVDKQSLQPLPGVALQPVLGETSFFVKHVAAHNPELPVLNAKELSRLWSKDRAKRLKHYKGWALCELSPEQARHQFDGRTVCFQPREEVPAQVAQPSSLPATQPVTSAMAPAVSASSQTASSQTAQEPVPTNSVCHGNGAGLFFDGVSLHQEDTPGLRKLYAYRRRGI
mmetsp:Transcript_26243/g.43496  ORF Transcript_26243/g.43496 Transcript_26243/m.43496 type:complete len:236 (+) Transcript_26243:166-873(+)